MKMFHIPALLTLILGLFFASGCVSEEIEPEHKPRLGVAQNSDGSLTMNLETKVGYEYTILYLSPVDSKWQVVKGCEAIEGTGEMVEIKKKFRKGQQIPPFTVDYVKKQ